MTPRQIRGYLLLKDVSTAELAEDLRVSTVAITRVIAGTLTSRRIMRHIAAVIGHRPEVVFPHVAHLFDLQHIRRRPSRSTQITAGISPADPTSEESARFDRRDESTQPTPVRAA